jgi:transposase
MRSKQDISRERVYKFFLLHRDQGKISVSQFIAEGISKSTIYRLIRRVENDSGHERAQENGRIAKKITPANIKRLKVMFDQEDGVSQRQAARKFSTGQSHIQKTFKSMTSIRRYKKKELYKRKEINFP